MTGEIDYERAARYDPPGHPVPLHMIEGNLDRFAGNVEREGSLVVTGDIASGLRVAVSGDLEVYGVVEDSEIEAGGKVYIHGGIIGDQEASIKAHSDVTVKFVQRGTIEAGGDVIVGDSVLFSTILAGGKLVVEGTGVIAGGIARAWVSVVAKEIGFRDPRSEPTEIEVGIDPKIRAKLFSLQESLDYCIHRIEELEKDVAFLREKLPYRVGSDVQDYYSAVINLVEKIKDRNGPHTLWEPYAQFGLMYLSLLYYGKERVCVVAELEDTRNSLVLLPQAEIVAKNIVHRGVRIVIGDHDAFTDQEFFRCRICLLDDRIVVERGL